ENLQEKNKEVLNIIASDVGVEHKSILANYNKNLIGFAANEGKYFVYGYSSDKGFTKKAELEIPINKEADIYYPYYYYMQNTRGIYIGDYFYLVSANGINSYQISDFGLVDSLIF
ncbi:MAG: beta-propeller domain-containing protein, partial [Clostridia bacterium]|nr:beta-propeller domain-containing protein [Clostridia bacterium]